MRFLPVPGFLDGCRDDTSVFFRASVRELHEVLGWLLENVEDDQYWFVPQPMEDNDVFEVSFRTMKEIVAFRLRFSDAMAEVV